MRKSTSLIQLQTLHVIMQPLRIQRSPNETGGPMTMALPFRQKAMVKIAGAPRKNVCFCKPANCAQWGKQQVALYLMVHIIFDTQSCLKSNIQNSFFWIALSMTQEYFSEPTYSPSIPESTAYILGDAAVTDKCPFHLYFNLGLQNTDKHSSERKSALLKRWFRVQFQVCKVHSGVRCALNSVQRISQNLQNLEPLYFHFQSIGALGRCFL